MKLAFSTLGCPQWTLDQIIDSARSLGYQGVEWRMYLGSVDLVAQFQQLPNLRARFAAAGLEIPCLDSSVTMAGGNSAEQLANGKIYIDLAASVGAPFLRVFVGGGIEGESAQARLSRVVSVFSELADYGEAKGVSVLLETHDNYATGEKVAEVLAKVPSKAAGAIWDVHHPHRNGESASETIRRIGDRIRYVHFKDATKDQQLTMPGKGELPLGEFVAALKQIRYDGYISFEWEKAWHKELPEPEVAFPAFVQLMRRLIG